MGRADEAVEEAALSCWVLTWSRKSWDSPEEVTVSTLSLPGGLTLSGQSTTRSGQGRVLEGHRVSHVQSGRSAAGISASPGKVSA